MGAQLTARDLRPLIGVSASEVRDAKTIRHIKEDEPPGREIVLGNHYIDAILAAGGMPVVIPPLGPELLDEIVDERIDGLCIPGGPDVDPSHYRAAPDPCLGPTDPAFDRFQLAIAERAVERELPLLAICRGIQVLNVSLGGTLIQHLPDHSSLSHRQEEPGFVPGHRIELAPGSRLADLTGETALDVNTYHHQAIDVLGRDLQVTAWAPDGVIEAVEGAGSSFLLGLQWHAELMAPRHVEARIFHGLVAAAGAHARHRREGVPR